jgi:lipoprotein-releasing system permease protein
MYKYLLCWRYLRTRWIALASIVSVTLGVATLIVVNAVMAGFTGEMHDRIQGVHADLSFDSRSLGGFGQLELHLQEIHRIAGPAIEATSPIVVVPAMLNYRVGEQWMTHQVTIVGGDPQALASATRFAAYLQHPRHRAGEFRFQLQEGGYDIRDHEGGDQAPLRVGMEHAGWEHRRRRAYFERRRREIEALYPDEFSLVPPPGEGRTAAPPAPGDQRTVPAEHLLPPAPGTEPSGSRPAAAPHDAPPDPLRAAPTPPADVARDPFAAAGDAGAVFDPARQQHTGCVVGIALASYRRPGEDVEHFLLMPGDDVQLTFPNAATPPRAISYHFTVVDFYASKMHEFDKDFVFVPLDKLQELRGMLDPQSGDRFVSSIQIKLRPGADPEAVRDRLRAAFPPEFYSIQTWRDKQGALLAAVQMETLILNVLLFLIIAVAGFGILAIFCMIVVEKTKDIGILKSLGARNSGVLGIFLAYGLSLGMVGSGVGLVLGLLFVGNINAIADWLGELTGMRVFDPSIYYFYEIPTHVDRFTVGWIVAGAVGIAVLASIVPACRAAWLRPVQALRYE